MRYWLMITGFILFIHGIHWNGMNIPLFTSNLVFYGGIDNHKEFHMKWHHAVTKPTVKTNKRSTSLVGKIKWITQM